MFLIDMFSFLRHKDIKNMFYKEAFLSLSARKAIHIIL